jgi:glyoxylase-like metal-dependent hydrolase (beta-lactamase superfamily II)
MLGGNLAAASGTEEIAPGVLLLAFLISNVYLLGEPGGAYIVVDTGLSGHFEAILEAAQARFGAESRPQAIVLTHAHVDHYGSALALAAYWNVPIYAHPLDLPYLTGKGTLPPSDPTVGGLFGFAARFLPSSGTDFGDFAAPIPADHSVPGLPDWRWIETPGHTPGHVSLYRASDRTIIAGDAVLTVDVDSAAAVLTKEKCLARPPSAATYDWLEVRKSALRLAALRPRTIASGHGVPMSGDDLAENLQDFANDFLPPLHGRYVPEPAVMDENGIVYVPPAPTDPLPTVAAGVGLAAAIAFGVFVVLKRQRDRDR